MHRGGGKGHRLVVHDRHVAAAPPCALSRRRPRQPAHIRRSAHLRAHAPRSRSRKIYHAHTLRAVLGPVRNSHAITLLSYTSGVCPEVHAQDGQANGWRGSLRTSLLAQLFSCERTPRRPTSPSMRPDRPTPPAARPRRGHAWRPPPALPASLNAPAWPSQNAIAVSGGPPGATALSCSHPPQESTRMHRSTLGRA